MPKADCGCFANTLLDRAAISFCSLHAAAPEMKALLKYLVEFSLAAPMPRNYLMEIDPEVVSKARTLLREVDNE